jgi:hypothetical protein
VFDVGGAAPRPRQGSGRYFPTWQFLQAIEGRRNARHDRLCSSARHGYITSGCSGSRVDMFALIWFVNLSQFSPTTIYLELQPPHKCPSSSMHARRTIDPVDSTPSLLPRHTVATAPIHKSNRGKKRSSFSKSIDWYLRREIQ